MHPYVHCSIIYNSQDTEATHVLINRQVDKKVVLYTWNLVMKKEWNLIICGSMGRPREYYAKLNKSEDKDKYHMISLVCGT